MLYDDIIDLTFAEVRSKFTNFDSVSSANKVIVFSNCPEVGSFSDESDIIVQFDFINNKVMYISERIPIHEVKGFFNKKKLKIKVREFNILRNDFLATYNYSSNKKYVDLVVVKKTIVDSKREGLK